MNQLLHSWHKNVFFATSCFDTRGKYKGILTMSMCCLCTRSVLSVLLWPLVVYHELIQRMYTGLEPILMKLDYSMKGDTEHRKHDKRSECYCDLDISLTRVHFIKTHACVCCLNTVL